MQQWRGRIWSLCPPNTADSCRLYSWAGTTWTWL